MARAKWTGSFNGATAQRVTEFVVRQHSEADRAPESLLQLGRPCRGKEVDMLGLFCGENGIAIGEGDHHEMPDLAALEGLLGRYQRVATFAVVLDDEPVIVGLFEQVSLSVWEKAIRKGAYEANEETRIL
jgi:hypothetical protein